MNKAAKSIKQSGRPPLKTGRKVHGINVLLSEEEIRTLQAMEKELGLNRSQIVRQRLLKDSDQQLINAREILKHLDVIGVELQRAGDHIEQLSGHAETLSTRGQLSEAIMIEFYQFSRNYIHLRRQTERSFRTIIRLIRLK